MVQRRAVVAGAGICGLAAGVSLALNGWTVVVYERSSELREFGAGIYLKENSLRALDQLGVSDAIISLGQLIETAEVIDEWGEVVIQRRLSNERLLVVLRSDLHRTLRMRAEELGIEIRVDRHVRGAMPDGTLLIDPDEMVQADVIIGADGVHSRVRESLGLTRAFITLPSGATRLVIPRQEPAISREYWAADHRVGVVPTSSHHTYVFLIGPEASGRARAIPVDRLYWMEKFPRLESVFDRITESDGVHHPHCLILTKSFTCGRVALIGDASFGQPPNLGQGAGVGIAAALKLAECLNRERAVELALARWEALVRSQVVGVQKWTTVYDICGHFWPQPLLAFRSAMARVMAGNPYVRRRWDYWWRGGMAIE